MTERLSTFLHTTVIINTESQVFPVTWHKKTHDFGLTSKACCGSVGPIKALQPLTASSLVSTINNVGPLKCQRNKLYRCLITKKWEKQSCID